MLRLYCPQLEIGCIRLPESEGCHALKSRRLRLGDSVVLFDGRGAYAHARLAAGRPERATASAGLVKSRRATAVWAEVTAVERVPPPAAAFDLIVAGCKGARLDWLVEKTTELGVTRLTLAEFERSVVHVGPTHVQGLERTAIEACKQSGRLWLPEISAGLPLSAAIGHGAEGEHLERRLAFADPTARLPLARWLESSAGSSIAAVVGPEGGLTPAEIADLCGAGGRPVRLAEHVLRVETAAIAVAAAWAAGLAWGGQ
jgi:16S rRNA (uracil1498-N3)-methyltransferase